MTPGEASPHAAEVFSWGAEVSVVLSTRSGVSWQLAREELRPCSTSKVGVTDCTFCRILRGELPSSLVFSDSHCAAFMDIHPINAGHVLIVPLSHAAQISDLEASTAGHVMIVAQRIAAALRASPLRCEGVNFLLADGEAAGQEVLHVHLHVVPRYVGDGFGFSRAPESKSAVPRTQLESAAAQLRAALERAATIAV